MISLTMIWFVWTILIRDAQSCSLLNVCSGSPIVCKFKSPTDYNLTGCSSNLTVPQFSSGISKFNSGVLIFIYPSFATHVAREMDLASIMSLILTDQMLSSSNFEKDIILQHFEGLDLNFAGSDLFKNWNDLYFNFYYLTFKLYLNGVQVPQDNCSYFESLFTTTTNPLSVIQSLKFSQVSFTTKICPTIFSNVSLELLAFGSILPEYYAVGKKVNASINTLTIQSCTKLELTKNILDANLFWNTKGVFVTKSSLYKIDNDLFKSMLNMKSFDLQIINLKDFLHTNGISWVSSINYDIYYHLNDSSDWNYVDKQLKWVRLWVTLTEEVDDIMTASLNYALYGIYDVKFFPYLDYYFSIKDFCLYKDFPFKQLIMIDVRAETYDSCMIYWLYQYAPLLIEKNSSYAKTIFQNYDLLECTTNNRSACEAKFGKCYFDQLIHKCDLEPFRFEPTDPYFNMYFLSQGLSLANVILINYTGPFVGLFGFISNLLTILTLADNYKRRISIQNKILNKDKEIVFLKEPLYQYMLVSSLLNAAYCLMYFLDYTIPCVPDKAETYAFGTFYTNVVTNKCVIVDLFVSILGSILKLNSNLSLIMMLVHRYILTGKEHAAFLVKVSTVSTRPLLIISVIVSSALTVVVYFQKQFFTPYLINLDVLFSKDYTYNHYYWSYNNKEASKIIVTNKIKQLQLLLGFTMLHDLFSYFLYCIISSILDILTILKLKEVMSTKQKVTRQTTRPEKNRDAETRGIIMIVLSSLSNFLLRAPELISVIFFYIFTLDGPYVFKMLCYVYNKCLTFVDLANIFYVLSLSLNFLFYVKFNSSFKCSFLKLFRLCSRN